MTGTIADGARERLSQLCELVLAADERCIESAQERRRVHADA